MKVVIFAGGHGTRLSEETSLRPKPMVEIGGKPILWHIMKTYATYGHTEFIICVGYKGYMIKEWFFHYYLHNANVTIDLATNSLTTHTAPREQWKVTLIDTGLDAGTANRLAAVQPYIGNEEFMLTYGDGVGDIDINALITFHKSHGKFATMTAVKPIGRFGVLHVDEAQKVISFQEKVESEKSRINAGFFVLRPDVFRYLPAEHTMWERQPMEQLASDGELMAYQHHGFWKPMDTLRDKTELEALWAQEGGAPWKIWTD